MEGDFLVCHPVQHHLQKELKTEFKVGRAKRGTQIQRGKEEKTEEEGNGRRKEKVKKNHCCS